MSKSQKKKQKNKIKSQLEERGIDINDNTLETGFTNDPYRVPLETIGDPVKIIKNEPLIKE